MPSWPIWLLWCFLVALATTAWARAYALRRNLLDQPGERRSHVRATPRGGGIAIVIVLFLADACIAWQFPAQRGWSGFFGAGLALVAGIGWMDDHRPLSPWGRLLVHALAGGLLAFGFWHDGQAPWVAVAAFLFAIGLTNVWNFMDGINGLAASQAGIVAAGLGIMLVPPWNWLALALVGATAGFLPFNFPKARVFLGDVGSGTLGYAVAALLAAALGQEEATYSYVLLLALPASAFIVDAAFTLVWRMLNRQRWWTPHVEHAYQRWARHWGHTRVTVGFALFTLLAVAAWHAGSGAQPTLVSTMFIMCYASAAGLWWWSRRLTD